MTFARCQVLWYTEKYDIYYIHDYKSPRFSSIPFHLLPNPFGGIHLVVTKEALSSRLSEYLARLLDFNFELLPGSIFFSEEINRGFNTESLFHEWNFAKVVGCLKDLKPSQKQATHPPTWDATHPPTWDASFPSGVKCSDREQRTTMVDGLHRIPPNISNQIQVCESVFPGKLSPIVWNPRQRYYLGSICCFFS